jgi:hypothetical protein
MPILFSSIVTYGFDNFLKYLNAPRKDKKWESITLPDTGYLPDTMVF